MPYENLVAALAQDDILPGPNEWAPPKAARTLAERYVRSPFTQEIVLGAMWPSAVMDRAGAIDRLLGQYNPLKYRPSPHFEATLRDLPSVPAYQPGPRLSEHVDDRRPTSVWSWLR